MSDDQKPKDENPEQTASDKAALEEAGYDTSDVGRGNKAMTEKNVAKETDSSSSEVSRAHHQAQDDMEEAGDMGIPKDRHNKSK